MIVTTSNIDEVLEGKQLNLATTNKLDVTEGNIGNLNGKNAVFDTLYVENRDGDVETSPTLGVGMNNVIIGREAYGPLPEKNVQVDIRGTINYNGERLEDMIDARVAAGGALPRDIECDTLKSKVVVGDPDLDIGQVAQDKTTIIGQNLDLRTKKIYLNKGTEIDAPRYGEDPQDINNLGLYRSIATRKDIAYDEANNFECEKAYGVNKKCRVRLYDHVVLMNGFTACMEIMGKDAQGRDIPQNKPVLLTRNLKMVPFNDRINIVGIGEAAAFNHYVFLPTLKRIHVKVDEDDAKSFDTANYSTLENKLNSIYVRKTANLAITKETDVTDGYDYETDKVANEETGEEEQGTKAPSIFTKGGILAMKRIVSGKDVTVVDPTDLTKKTTIEPQQIKTTNLLADEWVTAKNATITEGISAQNGTFTGELEVATLKADNIDMSEMEPSFKKIKVSNVEQGAALNRDTATESVKADVWSNYALNNPGSIYLGCVRFTCHRINEYLVYVYIPEIDISVSSENATKIVTKQSVCKKLWLMNGTNYARPSNISTYYMSGFDFIPFKIKIVNNADEEKTYDCEFRITEMYLDIDMKGQDLYENVREEGKELKTMTFIGLKGILPAPLPDKHRAFYNIFRSHT